MLHLAIATLLVLPQAAAPTAAPTAVAAAPAALAAPAPAPDGLFPTPSGPLTLEVTDPENEPSIADLVRDYCALTGQNAITSEDTKMLLQQRRLHLINSLTVPAEEVQHTFELLLRQNDFTLTILKAEGVRLIQINSLSTSERNNLRAGAIYVAPEDLDVARRHPAVLFTTVVTLPNTDVRQVSNSMRTMITDANTQQMLPAGNSNSIVLVGFGDSISSLADSLETIDAASSIGSVDHKSITELFSLKNATADAVAKLLQGALGVDPEAAAGAHTRILSDERTNSLIVVAPATRIAEIKALIAALDAK